MDTLRLVLIIIGLLIIGLVYLATRKSLGKPLFGSRSEQTDMDELIPEPPPLSDEDIAGAIRNQRYASDIPNDDAISQLSESLSAGVNKEPENDDMVPISAVSDDDAVEPLLIIFGVMAKPGALLQGTAVRDALNSTGFKHGEMDIFHYYDETAADHRAVCSLANSIEPGSFEIDNMEQLETPGLTLFMQLPGPVDARTAFEQTLKLGRILAEKLDADLCDETRSVLSLQSIEHLKEKIEAYRFKTRMAKIQQHRH
ncbi:MAG: cell division protein ZipA C-terminal FtsZ-binding domain-containing protein [Thioalkalispiraceae bacterium]|jgi:cell division protein ZipA